MTCGIPRLKCCHATPEMAVRMAVDLDIPSVLPQAFYLLAFEHAVGSEVGDGTGHGSLSHLTAAELRTLVHGGRALRRLLANHFPPCAHDAGYSDLDASCRRSSKTCLDRNLAHLIEYLSDRVRNGQEDPRTVLVDPQLYVDSPVCSFCRDNLELYVRDICRGEIWPHLREMFSLVRRVFSALRDESLI